MTCSAPTIAMHKDLGLRLMVEQMCSPPGFSKMLAGGQVVHGRGDVFDHFHVQHHVKLFTRLRPSPRRWCGDSRWSGRIVRHGPAPPECCLRRHRRQPHRRPAAPSVRPAARRRSRYRESAALERARVFQIAVKFAGDLAGDIVQPAGVEHMQRLELAVRIPPFRGHRLKFGDFGGVNCCLRRLHSCLPVLFWVR